MGIGGGTKFFRVSNDLRSTQQGTLLEPKHAGTREEYGVDGDPSVAVSTGFFDPRRWVRRSRVCTAKPKCAMETR